MKHGVLIFFSVILSFGCLAQSAHTVRLDTTALNFMNVGEGLPTADGGSVLQIPEPGGFSLWKCDADGQAQWRNHYPTEGQMYTWDIAPTISGDVLFVSSSYWLSQMGDSVVVSWDIRRIAQDGSVSWHRH